MNAASDRLRRGLEALDRDQLRRRRRVLDSPQGPRVRLAGRDLANFSSNDYLGLANHPVIVEAAHRAISEYGAGAGASPLVTGHLRIHERAEGRFAEFTGLPKALLFPSGYAANLGILTSLAGRGDEIFADKWNHACLNDGALLSNAKFSRYAHADLEALDRLLAASDADTKVVATDAVFSMDGDVADVPRLVSLCERHDAWLLLDDAHGIGVLGKTGRGVLEHFAMRSERIVYMATLGKALGGYGAFVAAEPDVIDWLVQKARTYVYSTALPPVAAGIAEAALALVDREPGIVACLGERIAQFRAACQERPWAPAHSITAIQPVIVGEAAAAMSASRRLEDAGFLVPAIRPPTVPTGTSRLRVSLCAAHSPEDIDRLVQALDAALGSGAESTP